MGHHIGHEFTSKYWTEHCNELIYRITTLYPENFVGGVVNGGPTAHSEW